jgi:hypothetical protein
VEPPKANQEAVVKQPPVPTLTQPPAQQKKGKQKNKKGQGQQVAPTLTETIPPVLPLQQKEEVDLEAPAPPNEAATANDKAQSGQVEDGVDGKVAEGEGEFASMENKTTTSDSTSAVVESDVAAPIGEKEVVEGEGKSWTASVDPSKLTLNIFGDDDSDENLDGFSFDSSKTPVGFQC